MAGLNPCAVEAEGETNTPMKPRNAAPAPSLMVKENVMARLPGFVFSVDASVIYLRIQFKSRSIMSQGQGYWRFPHQKQPHQS
jgi:hypothetical protein